MWVVDPNANSITITDINRKQWVGPMKRVAVVIVTIVVVLLVVVDGSFSILFIHINIYIVF